MLSIAKKILTCDMMLLSTYTENNALLKNIMHRVLPLPALSYRIFFRACFPGSESFLLF